MNKTATLLTAIAAATLLTAVSGWVVLLADETTPPAPAPKKAAKTPSSAAAKQKEVPKRPATPQELAQWAKDLDSDEFQARETATLNLAAAGAPAISHVKPMLDSPSLEASTRALHVLRELGLSSDLDTQDAAREVLEAISRKDSAVGKRAAKSIAWLNEQRSSQTIRDLENLGATIQRTDYSDDLHERVVVEAVQLGPEWKGEERDLRRLKWLVDVPRLVLVGDKMGDSALAQVVQMPGLKSLYLYRTGVTDLGMQSLAAAASLQEVGVYYSAVGDAAVDPLGKLRTLTSVKLYGTKVSPEATERLKTALNLAKIDYRRGAFLGVGCAPVDGQCVISTVHMGSPADKAGLESGDIIVRFAGKELKDFEGLTAIISQHQAGEAVELEILRSVFDNDGGRKGEPRKFKVTLGEWDVDLSVNGGRPRP